MIMAVDHAFYVYSAWGIGAVTLIAVTAYAGPGDRDRRGRRVGACLWVVCELGGGSGGAWVARPRAALGRRQCERPSVLGWLEDGKAGSASAGVGTTLRVFGVGGELSGALPPVH